MYTLQFGMSIFGRSTLGEFLPEYTQKLHFVLSTTILTLKYPYKYPRSFTYKLPLNNLQTKKNNNLHFKFNSFGGTFLRVKHFRIHSKKNTKKKIQLNSP